MATWSKISLQNSASPMMEQLIFFHDHTLLILTMITILVGYLMLTLFFNKFSNRFLLEGQTIETNFLSPPLATQHFLQQPMSLT